LLQSNTSRNNQLYIFCVSLILLLVLVFYGSQPILAQSSPISTPLLVPSLTPTSTPITLSDEDKQRIRAEEIYRQEVQKEIKQNSQSSSLFWKSFWGIVNSPFSLWFITVVVVGGFTKWFANFQEKKENKPAILRIDIEIGSRLNGFLSSLEQPSSFQPIKIKTLRIGTFMNDTPLTRMYEEHRNRSTYSLLTELHKRVPDKDKAEINKALKATRELKDIQAKTPGDRAIENLSEEEQKELLNRFNKAVENLKLPRWEIT
jgi:hypothetical protein